MGLQLHARRACRRSRWAQAAPLVTAALMAACGGGSGTSTADSRADLSSRDYIPAQVGDRWAYTDTFSTDAVLTRAIGTRSTDRGAGVAVKSDLPGTIESVFVRDAAGIWQYPGIDADAATLALGPIRLLAFPLRVGDGFVAVDRDFGAVFDFDGDGRADAARMRADTRVIATERLQTALGALEDCLHLRITATLQIESTLLGRSAAFTTVGDEWYAAGVGLVRSESVQQGPAGAPSSHQQSLVGYRVGSLRSDTAAPTASAPGISTGAVLGPATAVNVSFSEDMDSRSMAAALRVHDNAGAVVAGTTTVTGPRGVRFVPAASWASGNYQAALDTSAQDLLGNPIAAGQVWPFTIDATAPSLVETRPLEGSVDVALASSIELRFSEAVDPASVNGGTVRAIYDGALLTDVTYEVDGATVLLRPVAQLARGKRYAIEITGVTDLLGNVLLQASVTFTSDPGRFGIAQPLPAIGKDATMGAVAAIGDVTGDGRADVLADSTWWTGSGWAYGVSLYTQQQDGRLAPPVGLTLPDNCSIRSMRIADFDGDLRQDVAIAAASPCGVMLWRQTAAGQLELSRVIDPSVGLLASPDLNGDGRTDLVVAGTTELKVWLNLPTGWQLSDTLALTGAPNQLAVGDLNSDGRPDIAWSSIQAAEAATLSLQASDGHFRSVSAMHSGYGGGSFGIAIGDINSDGLADLVVGESRGVGVFHQDSGGRLGGLVQLDGTSFPSPLQLADMNADGRLDVVCAFSDTDLAVMLQEPGGSMAAIATYPDTFRGSKDSPDGLVIGDLNGDGRQDALLHGHLFAQRPVATMSQKAGAAQTPAARHWQWPSRVGAILKAAAPPR